MKERLAEKGVSGPIIERVVDRFTEYGYLNDHTFAQDLALRLFETKGWGFTRIGVKLRGRGVAADVVNEVVSQLRNHYSEQETALRLVQRRFSHINFQEASQQEKNRIILFLRRRGFSWETISRVVEL